MRTDDLTEFPGDRLFRHTEIDRRSCRSGASDCRAWRNRVSFLLGHQDCHLSRGCLKVELGCQEVQRVQYGSNLQAAGVNVSTAKMQLLAVWNAGFQPG